LLVTIIGACFRENCDEARRAEVHERIEAPPARVRCGDAGAADEDRCFVVRGAMLAVKRFRAISPSELSVENQ